jgi:hypothetical protein
MENHFATYNQSLALKKLGFDEPCFAYYQKSAVIGNDTILPIQIMDKASNFNDAEYSKMGVPFCSAPIKSQVFKWFRDEHKTQSLIQEYDINNYMFTIDDGINGDISVVGFIYYEEAESECIDKLIEIIKEKK